MPSFHIRNLMRDPAAGFTPLVFSWIDLSTDED
jgi:hypothetical protein